jgi:hypothetical protein
VCERERERGVGGQAGQQAGIFKVRLGLGEIEGRYIEIKGHRDRADNKNPEQTAG